MNITTGSGESGLIRSGCSHESHHDLHREDPGRYFEGVRMKTLMIAGDRKTLVTRAGETRAGTLKESA
jgi:hypothetical protein